MSKYLQISRRLKPRTYFNCFQNNLHQYPTFYRIPSLCFNSESDNKPKDSSETPTESESNSDENEFIIRHRIRSSESTSPYTVPKDDPVQQALSDMDIKRKRIQKLGENPYEEQNKGKPDPFADTNSNNNNNNDNNKSDQNQSETKSDSSFVKKTNEPSFFFNPKTVGYTMFGISKEGFRKVIIVATIIAGIYLYFTLRPVPITERQQKRNMVFFAKLNADKDVTVTYSGLMYRIISGFDLTSNNNNNDINDEESLSKEEKKELENSRYFNKNPNCDKDCVNISYQVRLSDGSLFDDCLTENKSCTFQSNTLIKGLHQGLNKMTRNSVFEFYVPPHLAYGENGSGLIPPHEPLIVRVKLVDFWNDPTRRRAKAFGIGDDA